MTDPFFKPPSMLSSGDPALGFSRLWRAQPLPDVLLDSISLAAAKLVLIVAIIGYAWALPRNLDGSPTYLFFGQAGVLIALSALSFVKSPLSGVQRISLIALVLLFAGMLAHQRNADFMAGILGAVPITTLLIIAYGTRIALALGIGIHVVFVMQASRLGVQDLSVIFVYGSISLVWSTMMAIFTVMLLVRIELDFDEINKLLKTQTRTNKIITHELKIPAMTVSRLVKSNQLTQQDVDQLREAAEHILLVIENMGDGGGGNETRPMQVEAFGVVTLVRQVSTQVVPLLRRQSIEFITDIDRSADVFLMADKFRLRSILVNLVRNAAATSDGYRVWLNIRGEPVGDNRIQLIMDVEDNGRFIGEAEIEASWRSSRSSDADNATNLATGLWVARNWLQQIQGELELFRSPRGGNGYRIRLTLPKVKDDVLETLSE